MTKKIPQLSIFFPFWNEEKNIEEVVKRAMPVAGKIAEKWEMILVDDGSSDKTLEIAEKLVKTYSNLKVVKHSKNRGYGASLKSGLTIAKYNFIVFTDGDNQFNFSEVTKFIDVIDNCDLVIGFRKIRHDHPLRHILMNLLKVWDLIFFGFYFKDIDCGFKLFRKESLKKLFPLKSEGAMITTEILAKAKRAKLRIKEVEVTHYPRKYGDQSGGNPRVIVRAVRESFNLWWGLSYGRN